MVMRLALQGSEIVVRLGGTLAKNIAAMMLALYKNHKMLYGKKNLGRILRSDLRDVRKFSMSMEQFKEFRKVSKNIRCCTLRWATRAGRRDSRELSLT